MNWSLVMPQANCFDLTSAQVETLREMLDLAERELGLYPANQPGAFHDYWECRRSALAAAIAQAETMDETLDKAWLASADAIGEQWEARLQAAIRKIEVLPNVSAETPTHLPLHYDHIERAAVLAILRDIVR